MIKKNRYSILSILSPFLGVVLIVIGISDNMILAPLSLVIGVILGFAFAVVSLFKKEKKLLSFIALVINTVIIVFGPDRFF
jgi:uncharacterized membrane protein